MKNAGGALLNEAAPSSSHRERNQESDWFPESLNCVRIAFFLFLLSVCWVLLFFFVYSFIRFIAPFRFETCACAPESRVCTFKQKGNEVSLPTLYPIYGCDKWAFRYADAQLLPYRFMKQPFSCCVCEASSHATPWYSNVNEVLVQHGLRSPSLNAQTNVECDGRETATKKVLAFLL